MSSPQIVAWYPHRNMVGDMDINIMTKNLYPVKEKGLKNERRKKNLFLPINLNESPLE